ncbi:unnamed protein product [Allacma fusca]|uniref:Uncharacterized protein n=1 Tax=Allacma fusca TaxID=39272 RepID=A0A8J2J4Q3_9HEXA|nr:unnamed protein product [Allacma fusca]
MCRQRRIPCLIVFVILLSYLTSTVLTSNESEGHMCSLNLFLENTIIKAVSFSETAENLIVRYKNIPKVILSLGKSLELDEQNRRANFRLYETRTFRFVEHCQHSIFLGNSKQSEDFFKNCDHYQMHSLQQFPLNVLPYRTNHVFIVQNITTRGTLLEQECVRQLQFRNVFQDSQLREVYQNLISFESQNFPGVFLEELKFHHFNCESYPTKLHIVRDGSRRPIGGTTYNFLKVLGQHYNFTFQLKHEGYRNLKQNPNGTWNGFIGDLIANKVDLAFALGNSFQRNPYADFTSHNLFYNLVFFTPLPRVRIKWQAIFYPFHLDVWFCIGLSYLFVIPSLVVTIQKSRRHSLWTSIYLSVAFPFFVFLEYSVKMPKNTRFLTGMFLFYAIIISTCFNSNLISFLTFPESDPVPTTQEELSIMSDYKVDIMHYPGAACDILFSTTRNPMYLRIKSRLTRVPLVKASDSLVRTALNGKSVTIDYDVLGVINSANTLTITNGFEPVKISRTSILSVPVSALLRKYSRYTEAFSLNVRKLESTGHFLKWLKDIVSHGKINSVARYKQLGLQGENELVKKLEELKELTTARANMKPFSLHNFVFCILCLLVGFFVSFLSFLCEICLSLKVYAESNVDKYFQLRKFPSPFTMGRVQHLFKDMH